MTAATLILSILLLSPAGTKTPQIIRQLTNLYPIPLSDCEGFTEYSARPIPRCECLDPATDNLPDICLYTLPRRDNNLHKEKGYRLGTTQEAKKQAITEMHYLTQLAYVLQKHDRVCRPSYQNEKIKVTQAELAQAKKALDKAQEPKIKRYQIYRKIRGR